METTDINIQIDSEVKKEAEKLFEKLGLNMDEAITLFLKSSINYNGIPFELRLPKEENLESDK